mgnify:CR=1 FL=1
MIEKIHIKNFLGIYDTTVELGRLTVLFGEPGLGKSTVGRALGFLSACAGGMTLSEASETWCYGRRDPFLDGVGGGLALDLTLADVNSPRLIEHHLAASYTGGDNPELLVADAEQRAVAGLEVQLWAQESGHAVQQLGVERQALLVLLSGLVEDTYGKHVLHLTGQGVHGFR